ncbi:AtpZ/AtpI family protein [candidate division KSB1 bacterium]
MTKRLGNNIYKKPSKGKPVNKDDRPWTVILGQYMSVTTQNVSVIAAGGLLGWYLDKKFETAPWLLIIGIFAGAIAGFIYLIRSLKP